MLLDVSVKVIGGLTKIVIIVYPDAVTESVAVIVSVYVSAGVVESTVTIPPALIVMPAGCDPLARAIEKVRVPVPYADVNGDELR